jgi:hypothetical protein
MYPPLNSFADRSGAVSRTAAQRRHARHSCPFSVLLSDDLGPNWAYASSIEKVILRCLKQPGFFWTA